MKPQPAPPQAVMNLDKGDSVASVAPILATDED